MKDRLLVISHVLPFPGRSGQEQRVRNMLRAAVTELDVDFLTVVPADERADAEAQLTALGCRPVVLESRRARTRLRRAVQTAAAELHALRTGLRPSNYLIGRLELTPDRVRSAVDPSRYRAALFEYVHAADCVDTFRAAGVRTILDMHNVLWKVYEQRLSERSLPGPVRSLTVARYRAAEEAIWDRFDALVAINRREYDLVSGRAPRGQHVFYAPMGIELTSWSAAWQPASPVRLAYYGGLGSQHNEAAALRCHAEVMPAIWRRFPDAQLWLVGSNPSERLRRLTADPRVTVTGFVEDVQEVLRTMSLVLCPWSGTYGFRSRIVEVMALGVPVITTPDALDGMDLESGRGVVLVDSAAAMAAPALELLGAPQRLAEQSRLAREEMQRLYSLDSTYGRLIRELRQLLSDR